jgi:anti-sigma-K factor RskA
MSETRDCGGDAAAYVLGALEADEATAFREHLASCVVCRDELAAFQQVVDALPMAAPQHPVPRRLRRRVLRAVRSKPKPARAGGGLRLLHPGAGRWPALAGAMLVTAALATAGGLELASGGSSGVRVIQARVTGSPGTAELRVAGGHAELIVRHLPPPSAGRIYELWLKRAGQAPSPTSALFSVTGNGSGDVGVPGDLRGVSEVLVTEEPAGGSLVPTNAPVIAATLA